MPTSRRTLLWPMAFCVSMTLMGAVPAPGSVYLDEVVIQGVERAELYNSGVVAVDLTGWKIHGDLGDFAIPDGTMIGSGAYLILNNLGGILHDIGGETSLIDATNQTEDRVDYGDQGGAPLPHGGGTVSLARAPDASATPPLDPADDAIFWTLDFTATFGSINDAPPANLGSTVVINEIDPSDPVSDQVEFFNPFVLAVNVPLVGWTLTDGLTAVPLTGVVPGGGVFALTLPTSIETTRLAYLFDDAGVRVDQVGFAGGPLARLEDPCIGRCPDGAGPSDGYNYDTSGGGINWIAVTCTIGESNGSAPECLAVATRRSSWGAIRRMFLAR